MTTTLEHALFYASNGWRVFPLIAKEKVPAVRWADVATTEKNMILGWWEHDPNANVGIATGEKSGLLVLDIDAGHGGEETLTNLEHKFGALPNTPVCRTGGGGRHFFFKYEPGTKNTASKIGAGIDTRSEGGYVVGANSLHPNGKNYEWDKEHLPSKTPLAQAPHWLLNMLIENRPSVTSPTDGAYISGQRNNALTSLAGAMRRKNMTEEAIFLALNAENLNRCVPPLPEVEVRLIAASVMRYGAQDAMPLTNRDRVQAEWAFIKCVYEFPESIPSYQEVKLTDFSQPQLRDYWQAVNSGIDATQAAAQAGILAEIEKYTDFDQMRQDGYYKQIIHYGYHSMIAKHAETLKAQAIAGNNVGVDKALSELNKIPSKSENRIENIADIANAVEEQIKERQRNPKKVWGIPYAWDYLSELTGGKHQGELTLVVAEPKIGKSWWNLQDALFTAVNHEVPVLYWCGEMKRDQMMRRFYQLLGVNGRNMKSGNMTPEDWENLADAKSLILNSPLFIDDKPLSLHEVRPMLKKQIAENGVRQAVFDYARLISAPGKDENEQSKAISLEMKRICQELNVAITLIVSVNKQGMDSKSETATKSNISGSGQQVHDADNIYFVTKFNGLDYGPRYGLPSKECDDVIAMHLTASRELDHILEGGFIPYQRAINSPKFIELKRKA